MAKRRVGRPNVRTRQLDPLEIEDDGERVPVAAGDLTLGLMEEVLVDEIRQITNNYRRDEGGRHFWTMSFSGGGQLVLIYSLPDLRFSLPDLRFVDWTCSGVRFERERAQLYVLAASGG